MVLKLAEPAVRILHRGAELTVAAPPVANVVDTTAAGDSFAAAYLAARLAGADARRRHDAGTASPAPSCSTAGPSFRARRCRTAAGCRRRQGEDRLRDPMKHAMSSDRSETADADARNSTPFCVPPRSFPVITIERADDGVPLARALVAGGLRALEITLRTPAAPAAASAIGTAVPEAVVGLGTVLTPQDLATARTLGARFAVSPGATPELLDAAARGELPFVPGVQTASEVMAALARGFEVVKLFPAVPAGGIAALKALAGPFPQVRFCPTGGIGEADPGRLAHAAQRRLRRRLLARAGGRHPLRQLAGHHGAGQAGGRNGPSSGALGVGPLSKLRVGSRE